MVNDKGDLEKMQTQAVEQLIWLRDVGGLTLKDIGKRIGAPHSTVSRWVHGHHKPTRRSCADIARIYEERRQEQSGEQTS